MDMSKRAGVTPTRKAEALAMRLALDDRASVEQAEPMLADFLDMVIQKSGAKSIPLTTQPDGSHLTHLEAGRTYRVLFT